jgi:isopenicillin-N epimerase
MGPDELEGLTRRTFLVRTGLLLETAVTAGPLRMVSDASALSDPAGSASPLKVDSWEVIRDHFPLARDVVHMAAFFLASHPTPVREALERHRQGLDANPIGYWSDHREELERDVLHAASEYLGAEPTDIALTDSTTMGLGLLYGGLTLKPGQEILTTVHDHYSTEMSLRLRAERTGAKVRQISLYRDLLTVSAQEIVETLVKAVRPETRIIAVTWVHSSTGLKLPIRALADALTRINGSRGEEDHALLCVDGLHGLGVEDFTVDALGCDFFVAGTHKSLFGPRGTGLVWGHPRAWPYTNATIPTFSGRAYKNWTGDGPSQPVPPAALMTPGGFHSFEHRWALSDAFRFHQAIGKARVTNRIHELNTQVKAELARMPRVTLRTPQPTELSAGIVCFEVDGWEPYEAVDRLRERKIMASVTPYATRYIRLAPSLLTLSEDIDRALREVHALTL